jgi:hypothetical protein
MNAQARKRQLLEEWAYFITQNAHTGHLTGGRVCPIGSIEAIAGPRVGALEIHAGVNSGSLMKSLSASQCALLRQFVPWHFTGNPQAFMHGRYVRIEAGWPRELATSMIRLSDLSDKPPLGGRFVAGMSEEGDTVVPTLDDRTPHFLISGTTGSGKSVTMRSIALQLSADPKNQLVLVDGKYGDSLRAVQRLAGVVGPCAVDTEAARNALGWVHAQMRQRYLSGKWQTRLVVLIDEVQEFIEDAMFVSLLQRLTSQGRAAHVHCIVGTQHPTVDSFGDTRIRRMLPGKIALMVDDPDASRVAVGGALPRADQLLGAGDAYTIGPGSCHRVQIAYADDAIDDDARLGRWEFPGWPMYEPEDPREMGEEVNWSYSGAELAVSIVSAQKGEGRPTMIKRLEEAGLGRPGSQRAARLLDLGREAFEWLSEHDHAACLPGNGHGESEIAPETLFGRADLSLYNGGQAGSQEAN